MDMWSRNNFLYQIALSFVYVEVVVFVVVDAVVVVLVVVSVVVAVAALLSHFIVTEGSAVAQW